MSTTTESKEQYTSNGKSTYEHGSNSSSQQTNNTQGSDEPPITNGIKHLNINNGKELPNLVYVPNTDSQTTLSPRAQQPTSPLATSSSEDYGIRRRTRTSSSGERVDRLQISTTNPPARKSADSPLSRDLTSSGSPPISHYMRGMGERRTSRNNLRVETSPHINPDPSTNSPTRFTLLSNAYQKTSISTGSLTLSSSSRPTTPTLQSNDSSPRSGSPDSAAMLPRSASDQTPKKKTIDDFNIGRVLGEGSYGAVCSKNFHLLVFHLSPLTSTFILHKH